MKAQESEFRDSGEPVKSLQNERSFMNAQPRNLQSAMTAPATPKTDDAKWEAVVARDPAADGTFYYSVKTTGVYCRPSCPTGRQALRPNVAFHPTAHAAEAR